MNRGPIWLAARGAASLASFAPPPRLDPPAAAAPWDMPLAALARQLAAVAARSPGDAARLAVHGGLGPGPALAAFGTPDQQARWLPRLASGELASAFALTEPDAGSDLSAIRATAVRVGDHVEITGEKRFITNAAPGRAVAVVAWFEGQLTVFVAILPEEGPTFRLVPAGLHVQRYVPNSGLHFDRFRVPLRDRIVPPDGDARRVIHHGLNRGRVLLGASAVGRMRRTLAGLLPWVRERHTLGRPLAERGLVRQRLARLAALSAGTEAVTLWAAGVIDAGSRGELEGIVVKTFAAAALAETLDLAVRTHGGRAFLVGHTLGDELADFLAATVYEGESELLALAFARALVKPPPPGYVDRMPSDARSHLGLSILRRAGRTLADVDADQARVAEVALRAESAVVLLAAQQAASSPELRLFVRQQHRRLRGRRPSDAEFRWADAIAGQLLAHDPD